MRTPRGFTLLEVLVAVAILGLGLATILSAQAGAFASAAHARHLSVATGLLRCKMTEIEEHLYRDGFALVDETGEGPCCDGDETPDMRCAWRVEQPQFPDSTLGAGDISGSLNLAGAGSSSSGGALGALGLLAGAAQGSGSGSDANPLAGASSLSDVAKTLADANASALAGTGTIASSAPLGYAAPSSSPPSGVPGSGDGSDTASGGMGGLASLAMSIVYPSLKVLFEASTRRVTTTLTFHEGKKEYNIDVVEWFCLPQQGLAVDDGSATSTTTSSSSGGRVGGSGSSSGKP
jgi:general secretion pathway protein I